MEKWRNIIQKLRSYLSAAFVGLQTSLAKTLSWQLASATEVFDIFTFSVYSIGLIPSVLLKNKGILLATTSNSLNVNCVKLSILSPSNPRERNFSL